MSTSTTGPPPGFESMNVNSDSAAADVTAPDPTDVPQSTSLGGGDPRRTGDQSEVPASDLHRLTPRRLHRLRPDRDARDWRH